VKQYTTALQLTVIAYCLLPNHYHLLVRQDADHAAGLLPQRIFNSYSKAYNRRYRHSGTLFEGPYKVVAVESDGHLLQLCRYIHANPVTHGLVADLEAWPYTNYLEWVERRAGTLVDRAFVQDHFPSHAAYRDFVADYLRAGRLPDGLQAYLSTWGA
jgi:REP element-mobilizing transposase RayT